jgi:hypothetical protein
LGIKGIGRQTAIYFFVVSMHFDKATQWNRANREIGAGRHARLLTGPFEQGTAKPNRKLQYPDLPKQGHAVMPIFMNKYDQHQRQYERAQCLHQDARP